MNKQEKQYMYVLLHTIDNNAFKHTMAIGVYTTPEYAAKALDIIFHNSCTLNGIEELGIYSYYTEGEYFHLNEPNMKDKISCEIVKVEVDNI